MNLQEAVASLKSALGLSHLYIEQIVDQITIEVVDEKERPWKFHTDKAELAGSGQNLEGFIRSKLNSELPNAA